MTIDPKTGLPRGEKPPASTAAVVALVCGILLCLGPFTGIPAIIAGVLARKAARQYPQTVGGAGMGLAGILLGSLNLVLSAIAGLLARSQVASQPIILSAPNRDIAKTSTKDPRGPRPRGLFAYSNESKASG